MKRIYVPTHSPEDWRNNLAQPKRQWKRGYSARTLAYCWEEANGLPREVAELFLRSSVPAFERVNPLLAFPEYKVSLPGGGKASQNDLFVLAVDVEGQLIAMMIEGKVSEPFGPTLKSWNTPATPGRSKRLKFIEAELGLPDELPGTLRYQLLHRAVSAVLEARRFHALSAAVIVHSFSQTNKGFADYQQFVRLFDIDHGGKDLVRLKDLDGIQLYSGWATGDARFLEV